jgi:hypothetical protein
MRVDNFDRHIAPLELCNNPASRNFYHILLRYFLDTFIGLWWGTNFTIFFFFVNWEADLILMFQLDPVDTGSAGVNNKAPVHKLPS